MILTSKSSSRRAVKVHELTPMQIAESIVDDAARHGAQAWKLPGHRANIAQAILRERERFGGLLAACEALVQECETSDGFDPNLEGPEHEALETARAAIRRARGEE